MHWSDAFTSAGPIGRLVTAASDPLSGQPELKLTPVRVSPIAPLWRGLLMRHRGHLPAGPYYWARVPLRQGHLFDLAGWEPLPSGPDTERWILGLLGAPAGPELVIYADPRRGVFRYASLVDGRLDACLFLARDGAALPSRDTIEGLLGAEVAPDMRLSLLSGQHAEPEEVQGRTICACFGVGLRVLQQVIVSHSLATVGEIGAALRAGTNCGSCIPELKAILRDAAAGVTLSA
jgi:assimilatory nitrate reductase catalytic subunit